MKNNYLIKLLILIIFIFTYNNIKANTSIEDQFNDENLKQAIASLLYADDYTYEITDEDIQRLERIVLNNKNISDISGIEIFTNVYELNLDNNNITEIPASFASARFDKLDNFYISYNNLETLPTNLFTNTPNIQIINLENNNFSNMPEALANAGSVVEINLNNNTILSIPTWFDGLHNIRYLYLDYNQLTNLDNIYFQSEFRTLSATYNRITNISDNIKNATNLQRLALSNNKINTLNDSLLNISHLENLYLQNNCITYFSYDLYQYIDDQNGSIVYENQQANINLLEGYILDDYVIDSLSVFKIFSLNNDDVTFELYNANNELIPRSINRIGNDITLVDGIITIGSDLFNSIGNYKLIANVTSGDFIDSVYTINFSITNVKKISPSIDDTNNNDTIISDNKDIPITGNNTLVVVSILLLITLLSIYRIKED